MNQSLNGSNIDDGPSVSQSVSVKPSRDNRRNVHESVSLAASRARGRGFKPTTGGNGIVGRTPTTPEIKPKGHGTGALPIAQEPRRTVVEPATETKRQIVPDSNNYQSPRQNSE